MDEDLEQMSHAELVDEVKRLHKEYAHIGTAAATSCAGIIRRCGDSCLRQRIPFPKCRPGRSSWKAASGIVNRSTTWRQMRRVRSSRIRDSKREFISHKGE